MSKQEQLLESSIRLTQNLQNELLEMERAMFYKKGKKKMFIPGNKIGVMNKYVHIMEGKDEDVPDLRLPEYAYKDLVAPTGHVILQDQKIKILAVCFVNKSYELEYKDFTCYYGFSYDRRGGYLINLYITFDKQEKKAVNYKYYSFEFEFEKGAIRCADGFEVPMEKIKTVQLFLINKDPETSRGTETTVQSGDD